MATFRDLALEADRCMIAATSRLGVLSQADAAQVAGELAALSRICGRVLDDVLDGSAPHRAEHGSEHASEHTPGHTGEGAAWRVMAGSGRRAAEAAELQFERAAAVYGRTREAAHRRVPPSSAALRSAIRKLRQAEELLQAALTPGDPGRRRPRLDGPYGLGDPDTAREITGLAGRWIGLVGEIADRLAGQVQVPYRPPRVDVAPISQMLQQAAGHARRGRRVITRAVGPATQLSHRLAELSSARTTTTPCQKSGPELVQELLARADEQASALRKIMTAGPPGSRMWHGPKGGLIPKTPIAPRSLRYVANLAGSAHAAAAIIARQLAARVAELTGSTRGLDFRALSSAADALIESGRAWDTAARRWDLLTSRDLRLDSATAQAATGTVMRLGHAAYADSDWTPTSRNTTVRPAAEFAADLDAVRQAAGRLDSIVSAYTGAARASTHAISTLHEEKKLFAELGDNPVRAPEAHIADLCGAYDAVLQRATTAQRWLRTAHGAAVRDPDHAPALATADFPNQPLARPDPTTRTSADTPARPAAGMAATPATTTSEPVPVPAPGAATVRPSRRTR